MKKQRTLSRAPIKCYVLVRFRTVDYNNLTRKTKCCVCIDSICFTAEGERKSPQQTKKNRFIAFSSIWISIVSDSKGNMIFVLREML